jgi:hypothetical protein
MVVLPVQTKSEGTDTARSTNLVLLENPQERGFADAILASDVSQTNVWML